MWINGPRPADLFDSFLQGDSWEHERLTLVTVLTQSCLRAVT